LITQIKQGYVFQISLPFLHRVIFVDWHGVLSDRLFWHSIVSNELHPLHTRLRNATERFFTRQTDQVRSWMRGDLASSEIINGLDLKLPKRYGQGYLQRTLFRDCRLMSPNTELLEILQSYRNHFWLGTCAANHETRFERFIG